MGITSKSVKIKRGTEFIYTGETIGEIKSGNQVWVELQQSNYKILVCDSAARELEDNYESVNIADLKEPFTAKTAISKLPKPLSEAKKKFKAELNILFGVQALKIPGRCENCGQPIIANDTTERRACIAHILPKSEKQGFPEVAIHPQNRMFLSPRCCHGEWDNTDSEHRKTMPCYKIALVRFEQFKHLLTGKKLIKAYTYLGIEWQ